MAKYANGNAWWRIVSTKASCQWPEIGLPANSPKIETEFTVHYCVTIYEKKNAVHCTKILTVKNHTKLTANMAPHCDTVDGPVVVAARKALDTSNVNFVLPWVSEEDESELKAAFEKVIAARRVDNTPSLANVIDLWFFETAVRLHRKGEGAPYTGLGPAGVDEGPIIPMAERALETRNPDELIQLLLDATEERLRRKFEAAVAWQGYDVNDVTAGRQCVHNMLDFVLFANNLCEFVKGRELGASKSDRKHLEESKRRADIIKSAAALGHHHCEANV